MEPDVFQRIRQLFIQRMTVDSDTKDRRRKDFNQAIFHYETTEDIDHWNSYCESLGLSKKPYGSTYPVWTEIDMDMVLNCFDKAILDYKKESKGKE